MKYPKIKKKMKKTERTCYECKFSRVCTEKVRHWWDNDCGKFKLHLIYKSI